MCERRRSPLEPGGLVQSDRGLGQQQRMWRRCRKRASTLVQGASRRPRGGRTMTLLSGFPGVPAQKPGRRSLPQEWPEGLSLALPKAVPVGQARASCARWSRGRATAPPKAISECGRTRTVTRRTGQASSGTRRIRSMAALGGLGYYTLRSLPWVAGATQPWRREPLGTQGMRLRTPSGGMARPGAIPHTQGRNCFPAFPIVKAGGPIPDPAARAD